MSGHAHEMRNDPTVPDKLEDPTGEALTRTEVEGIATIATIAKPTIPTTIHGFAVRVGISVYPPDAPASHRRAVYADLTPVSPEAVRLCRLLDRERVLGWVPLTPHGAKLVSEDPGGSVAERAGRDALQVAVREIRRYLPDGKA